MFQKNKAIAALAAAVVMFGACDDSVPPNAPLIRLFGAALDGASERPNPVTTTSAGTANITIIDTNVVRVQTIVSAIDSVTQAHIHAGDASVAGPIMVFLVGPVSASQLVARGAGTPPTTTLNGVLSHVDITRGVTAFSGAFTFDSLLTRITNGTAYVNVHTRANPSGQIRGQIVPQ
jgi:hypothetical protein